MDIHTATHMWLYVGMYVYIYVIVNVCILDWVVVRGYGINEILNNTFTYPLLAHSKINFFVTATNIRATHTHDEPLTPTTFIYSLIKFLLFNVHTNKGMCVKFYQLILCTGLHTYVICMSVCGYNMYVES